MLSPVICSTKASHWDTDTKQVTFSWSTACLIPKPVFLLVDNSGSEHSPFLQCLTSQMFFSEDCQNSAKHHSIRQMECYIARNIPAATNPRWSMISSPSLLFIFTLLSLAFTSKCDQSSQFFILSTKPQPSPKLANKFIARQRCRHPNTKYSVPEMVILFLNF